MGDSILCDGLCSVGDFVIVYTLCIWVYHLYSDYIFHKLLGACAWMVWRRAKDRDCSSYNRNGIGCCILFREYGFPARIYDGSSACIRRIGWE